jgi:hypothetical protein
MSVDLRAIVAKLRYPTKGTYRFHDWLCGPHMAALRAELMSELTGQRMPQSKSGITALGKELYRLAGVEGNCGAAREDAFCRFAAELLNDQEWLTRHAEREAAYQAEIAKREAERMARVDVSASPAMLDKAHGAALGH